MKTTELTSKNERIRIETWNKLKSLGNMGETFSDVIDNIIDYGVPRGMTRETLTKMKLEKLERMKMNPAGQVVMEPIPGKNGHRMKG